MTHLTKHLIPALLLILPPLLLPFLLSAQAGQVQVSLAALDGVALTPDNITSFSVQSQLPVATPALIKGTLRYRATGLSMSYSFHYTLRPGMNLIDASAAHPQWSFSQAGLRDLFLEYKKLPEGAYEYCVTISPQQAATGEAIAGADATDCLYGKAEDIFLINLVDPENNAKIYEYNPVLSWVVNYPFALALTYRVRVAPVEAGQNTVNAIARNNPVYQEANLAQTSVTYPVYAKPLELNQPYAWTVDAYYKGILLGGAEPWKFTIIEDSVLKTLPHESYFVDIRKEQNNAIYYAVGEIKLKYVLSETMTDSLTMIIYDAKGKAVPVREKGFKAVLGDNRYQVNLKDQESPLQHLSRYFIVLKNGHGTEFRLPVRYVNPDFLR